MGQCVSACNYSRDWPPFRSLAFPLHSATPEEGVQQN